MLYHEAKKEAIAIHEKAARKYNEIYEHTKWLCEKLYDTRRESLRMIGEAEELINSIAKTPKEFGEKLQMIFAEREKFHATEEFAMQASEESKKMGLSAAAGVAGGAAVASMAPTAMMWVATTFGTASTGTAISSLSGAVATKAALAWLGGGALSAGGAGIAGGQALLALAGPIGWGIAGTSVGLSAIFQGHKNKELAEKAVQEAQKITVAGTELKETSESINDLQQKTLLLHGKLSDALVREQKYHGADYETLAEEEQLGLGAFVNNTLALAELLNKTV